MPSCKMFQTVHSGRGYFCCTSSNIFQNIMIFDQILHIHASDAIFFDHFRDNLLFNRWDFSFISWCPIKVKVHSVSFYHQVQNNCKDKKFYHFKILENLIWFCGKFSTFSLLYYPETRHGSLIIPRDNNYRLEIFFKPHEYRKILLKLENVLNFRWKKPADLRIYLKCTSLVFNIYKWKIHVQIIRFLITHDFLVLRKVKKAPNLIFIWLRV